MQSCLTIGRPPNHFSVPGSAEKQGPHFLYSTIAFHWPSENSIACIVAKSNRGLRKLESGDSIVGDSEHIKHLLIVASVSQMGHS